MEAMSSCGNSFTFLQLYVEILLYFVIVVSALIPIIMENILLGNGCITYYDSLGNENKVTKTVRDIETGRGEHSFSKYNLH